MRPANATDSHFHVFDPVRFPARSNARYELPTATVDEMLALAKTDGIERFVFVQPSAYVHDNGCMLDAMQRVGPERCKGVVGLPVTISEAELKDLHARGVRGVRINTSPVQKFDRDMPARVAAEATEMARKIKDLGGWSLDFLGPAWLTTALIPTFRTLPLDYTIAHMGMFLPEKGLNQPGIEEFLDLMVHGRAWVKLTGLYRITDSKDFADVAPLAKAVIAKNPDRVIWGSDWPHVSFAGRVTNARLLELLDGWCGGDATLIRKILVDNPARFYGL